MSRKIQYWIIVILLLIGLFVKAQPNQAICALRHTPTGTIEAPVYVYTESGVLHFKTAIDGKQRWIVFNNPVQNGDIVQSAVPEYDYIISYFRMKVVNGIVRELEVSNGRDLTITYNVVFDISKRTRQWE